VSEVAGTLIGRLVDSRYEVVSKLGSGRVADVYLANDRVLGRQVALKVLTSRFADDAQFLERFRREVNRAARLNHPKIVQISHRGQAEGTYYVAMEYLEGRSLQAIILEHAPLSADLITSVSLQILEALRFAHRQNVVHGDLEPEDIIVDSEGRVTITNFGIARAAQERPVDAASDLYSLGVVMYQMAAGRLPFEEDDAVSIPGKLGAIIMRSLGLGPADGYLTAQAMLEDMREAQEGEAEVTAHGFAEEAARVMAATTAAEVTGGPGTAGATRASRLPDELAPIIEPYEEPGRPRRVWPWVLVTILTLALAAAAYVIVSNQSGTAKLQFGTTPEVVGLTEAKAISKIRAAGFGCQIEGREPSSDVDEGDVVRQNTAGGTKLEKGKTVRIWISSGTGQIAVPDVVGLTQAEAAETLRTAGLEAVAKPEVGSDVEIGRVLRQNPDADKKVNPGATVTITVAAVTNTVKVPPLTGMTQDSAAALLKGLGLVADVQGTDSALPGGTVDHQDPVSASEVQPGTTVKIFVSNAPAAKTVIVPAVGALGLTEAKAKAMLAKYRLKAKVIDLETPDFKPGLCIYQDPVFGVEVKIGSVVNITIARKPTTTTLPPPPAGATRYDQTDRHIVKTGIWADYSVAAAYLGSYGRSSAGGTSATIYFSGTRLDWIAMKGTTTGIVDVYLDGVKKATINLAAPAATYMVNIWSTGTLARGSHKVTIVLSSRSPAGKYLTLDAVDIWGTIRTAP
jgi:beta-lactam-binding protein with PASTA domain/tRNA A-37 threonylcarbamoyl transferase component Bud32